ELPGDTRAPAGGDSLSMLKGGWLADQQKKAEEARTAKTGRDNTTGGRQQTNTASTDWRKRGNAANCKPSRQGGPPYCDWYDAMAYCGGRLPTVAQLQAAYKSECTGGRKADTCTGWYWSSEESGASDARLVNFSYGTVNVGRKYNVNVVRCAR
ncbi:MAG: hypothetical protein FD189_2587, partial [Elusimicrobia bacterium]